MSTMEAVIGPFAYLMANKNFTEEKVKVHCGLEQLLENWILTLIRTTNGPKSPNG
jgi:hypothetical protein